MAANHWVCEVFPVKYSLDEVLNERAENGTQSLNPIYAKEKLKDLYEDAFARVLEDKDHLQTPEKHLSKDESPEEEPTDSQVEKRKANGCIWTKEELDVFREGYFNLKKRAVHLLILLSDSKSRNKELRKKCKSKSVIISNQDRLLDEQKKQNLKLNATIKELRKDLDFSEKKMQQMLIIEAQLKDQNAFLKNELDEERKECSKARMACDNLDKSLKRTRKETVFGFMQQENVLKAKHMYSLERIEEENKRLRMELVKEKNDHQLTRTALDQLRRHYANMQDSGTTEAFLDVAEIEKLSLKVD